MSGMDEYTSVKSAQIASEESESLSIGGDNLGELLYKYLPHLICI